MRFFVIPLLLAAAVSGEVFQFAGKHGPGSTVYGVWGGVTVGTYKLTGEKSALEYNGTLAIDQVREGEYVAKFTQFTLGKYDKLNRNIHDETFGDLTPEEQRLVKTLREQGLYQTEMQRPVKFFMKEGKVIRMEAEKEHQQWSLNIFRGVFTLLQNKVRVPATLAVPSVEYTYEDGITGNCKVQYEIISEPEDQTVPGVYNMTKTYNYKDCLSRPVYLHLKDSHRGCAGVCDNHKPENFLGQYEEEQTDYEMKPTPGCPVNRQRKDTLVAVHNVAKYNVSKGFLDEAFIESTDVYHLFGAEIEVFTQLHLVNQPLQGPKIEEPKNTMVYETLQQRLPKEEEELDIPVYALMKEHSKHQQYPQYFQKHFEAVIRELRQLQSTQKTGQEQQAYDTPAYMIELIQAISGMTEEEIKRTIPAVVRQQQPKQLNEEEQLRRQIWIELLGKAGSKASVKVATELIQKKIFTPTEVRRVLQDIAGFQSYPDTEMIELVLGLCTKEEGLTSTGKATACVAAGKIISKGCNSKVYQWAQKEELERKTHRSMPEPQGPNGKPEYEPETEEYEMTMGHLAIEPRLRCTPEKLQHYIERLSVALRTTTDFKQVVAYINGLAKIEKPEVLPELIGYVNGTAPNMQRIHDQNEDKYEAIEFVRRVAILSLRSVAEKYPKEVNPIVRVIYQNTTEETQTRIIAFDVWMNTQPAQWEVEKIMQVANKDTSLELTNYVYTALKTAMLAKEPCYQLLAQRIRAAWAQIRPFNLGMQFSHLRSKAYYNTVEDFGIRGIWKMIASNTTVLPTYTQTTLEQVRGPFMKTLLGAKLLVKGGDKVWESIVAKDGLLERIALAVDGKIKNGPRQQDTEKLIKDIAQGMDLKDILNETPKAVLYWKLFSGEAIIPIDAEYVKEVKQELFQTVTKFGKEGITGHFVRVFVPTKAFHVEPSTVGFPIVHSTIHPIVISVRYENLKVRFDNKEGRIVPETFELTGTIQPTVLSLRQNRVFVAEKVGQVTPTVKISDVKEFNLRVNFRVAYEENRVRINVKPQFERLFHTGHCTEFKLEKNTIVDEEPRNKVVDYNRCIMTLNTPVRRDMHVGGPKSGMVLRLTGESHQPWSGLPMFGSKNVHRQGIFGAIINRLANKGMKHHAISLYLEADKQQPINEWAIVIDMDSNIEALAKIPLREQTEKVHKIKVQYKPRHNEPLNNELQQVIRKVEQLLEKVKDEIEETTVEKQMLIKIEGRHQGQPKRVIKVAMKKIYNLEKTEQQYAFAAEIPEARKGLELFANVSYPKIGSPFHYDPTIPAEHERMNGTLIAKLQGQQEQMYRINFEALKSEEQRTESELEWFEVRCLAEQKAGKTMTDACKKAILKDNSLDRFDMIVKLPRNVSPKMRQLAKKALAVIKYKFYPQMQSEISGRQYQQQQQLKREEQEIHISANTTRESAWSLLYNVRFEMPRENVTLYNIRLPVIRPVHMQLTTKEQLEHVVYRGQKENVCILGEKAVRTYDNVTFGLDVKTGCEYVLTRDQSEGTPDFTVTFQVMNPETFTKKVRVQLYNTLIEVEPFTTVDRQFHVIVNGTKHMLTFDKPVVFDYATGKRVFINAFDTSNTHHAPVVHVYTESKELRVLFNGHAIKTLVDNKYKGVVNGICGNNDNEQTHEFVGPTGTEYEHGNEFIASYGIGQTCKVPVENTKEKLMERLNQEIEKIRREEQIKRTTLMHQSSFHGHPANQYWHDQMHEEFWGKQEQYPEMQHDQEWNRPQYESQEDRQILKTAVSIENGHVCFSVKPVPACKQGYHKEGVLRTERVESICLERNHEAAIQAMQDIRKGLIVDVTSVESHKGRLYTMLNIPKCERHD